MARRLRDTACHHWYAGSETCGRARVRRVRACAQCHYGNSIFQAGAVKVYKEGPLQLDDGVSGGGVNGPECPSKHFQLCARFRRTLTV